MKKVLEKKTMGPIAVAMLVVAGVAYASQGKTSWSADYPWFCSSGAQQCTLWSADNQVASPFQRGHNCPNLSLFNSTVDVVENCSYIDGNP